MKGVHETRIFSSFSPRVHASSGVVGKGPRSTVVLSRIPHSNCCKRGPNRPSRSRKGRFGTLLEQLECGISWRTAVELQKCPPRGTELRMNVSNLVVFGQLPRSSDFIHHGSSATPAPHPILGLLRTPGASLRASLRASPGRLLGVVRP